MLRPGTPVSRLAALVILVGGICVPYFLIAAPLMAEHKQLRAQIEDAWHLIQRYEARRDDIGALKSALARLRADRTAAATFIRAKNPSLAAANIQGRLSRLVAAHKGKMTSAQPVPTGKKETFQRVSVRARMSLSTDGLRRVLYRLESGKPYLFLDNVIIRRNARARRPRPNRKNSIPDVLDVRFDVHGFLWAKGSE